MILYKKTPIPFKMKNVMMLDVDVKTEDGKDSDSVVYVSKNTYDQCVRMHSRFEGELNPICRFLGVDRSVTSNVDWFFNNMPEPLNILAPFIGILEKSHSIEAENAEQMLGYLHILSQMINFDGYSLVSQEVRADVSVGNAVLKSYKESWSDIETSLEDIAVPALNDALLARLQLTSGAVVPAAATQTNTTSTEESSVDVDLENAALFDEEFESEDDFVKAMNALVEQAAAEAEAETKALNKSNTTTSATSATASVTQPEMDSDKVQRELEMDAKVESVMDSLAAYV